MDGVDSRLCPPAATPLGELIIERNYNCGVELGIWLGASSKFLLDLPMIEHLYMVDPWSPAYQYGTNYTAEQFEGFYRSVKELIERYGKRKTILRMDSTAAKSLIPKEQDFVFIDADHSFKSVIDDINNYRYHIRKDGILCGDDFHFRRVNDAVTAVFGSKVKTKDYGFISKEDGRLFPATIPNRFWYVEYSDL